MNKTNFCWTQIWYRIGLRREWQRSLFECHLPNQSFITE